MSTKAKEKPKTFSQQVKEKTQATKDVKAETKVVPEVLESILSSVVAKAAEVESVVEVKDAVTETKVVEVEPAITVVVEVAPEVKEPEVKTVAEQKPKEVELKGQTNIFKGIVIDPRKTYEFRLNKSQNPRTLLPRETKVWDEESGSTRTIRLCSVEPSPYADEQRESSTLDTTTLCFTDGILKVRGTEENKLKYLLAYDGYDQKKKVLDQNIFLKGKYCLIDYGKITENDLSLEEAKIEAKVFVKGLAIEDLSDFLRARFLTDVVNKTDNEIRKVGYTEAGEAPYVFLEDFTNPLYKIKAGVQKLFVTGQLSEDNGAVRWTDTKGKIIDINPGDRSDEILAKWVLVGSPEAKDFEKVMKQKI